MYNSIATIMKLVLIMVLNDHVISFLTQKVHVFNDDYLKQRKVLIMVHINHMGYQCF